ncbi:MAG TPA: M1 family aminopeptidase, partial [Vicinamibacterales bacterium]
WFGPYPYGHITIVDPAWQSGSGGMEYPTLFTAGTRWLAPSGVTTPEGVTIHEAGHQFWHLLVANNEVDYAWLDEGLNTYATARVLAEAFSPSYHSERFFGGFIPWVYRGLPLPRETVRNRLPTYRPAAESDTPARPSWQYHPATGAQITYAKTALWLHTLERMLGWPTVQKILATFFERWRFRHPTPDDFFAVANEVSGRDLRPFFDQVYRSSHEVDYGIQQLTSTRVATYGFGDDSPPRFARNVAEPAAWETIVVVRRYGEAILPVDVEVEFENGERWREQWDGRERWHAFRLTREARARTARVDPDRVLLLDVNLTNNSRSLHPMGATAARRWALTWLTWMQDRALTFGMAF